LDIVSSIGESTIDAVREFSNKKIRWSSDCKTCVREMRFLVT